MLTISMFYDRVVQKRKSIYTPRVKPISLIDFEKELSRDINLDSLASGFLLVLYDRYVGMFNSLPTHEYLKSSKGNSLSKILGICGANTKLAYYTSRGHSEQEAIIRLAKRQSTNTVDYLISKGYSIDEAKELHSARQQRGVKTLKARDDIAEINKAKGWLSLSKLMQKINPDTDDLYTYDEAKAKIDQWSKEHAQQISDIARYKHSVGIQINSNCNLRYWLDRCNGDLELAKQKLADRQNTRGLSKYIAKYGEVEGRLRFHQTVDKWMLTMNSKSQEEKNRINALKFKAGSKFYSKASVRFFDKLKSKLQEKHIDTSTMRYADHEWYCFDADHKMFFYDCKIYNIVIEYNGSHVHPNKDRLTLKEWEEWMNPFTHANADETYAHDQHKLEVATQHGNEVYVVWDLDDEDDSIDKLVQVIELRSGK